MGNAAPRRIQRKRTKGWRKPDNTVIVDRTSRWGNPWIIKPDGIGGWMVTGPTRNYYPSSRKVAQRFAVWMFRHWVRTELGILQFPVAHLRGKNLMCFCRLDQPCHADVLLEIANE